MNFKEMQLVGFKSFADKTNVRLDDGVTCIVGPNGCGKSNVADAVRWVLGEQSAKSLRGSNMQDVIFNGTEKRRSLSFCEVTLLFDNTDKKLFDIDYQEVGITRRLYRSGESEYLLNKQPCRLKDIVNLLHGVGIGKEGYSIIGQGKVEQIMNAKPEDRRTIFEEATGIMIQKQRKLEIERKIESSEDNLSIYKQRMAEAERQLGPLEKQAETAKKYKEFSEDLKFNEANTYIFRYENAAVEKEKYSKEADRLDKEMSQLNDDLDKMIRLTDSNREKLSSADAILNDLHNRLTQYTVGITQKDGNAKLFKERANSFRDKLQQGNEEIKNSLHRIDEIEEYLGNSSKKTQDCSIRLQTIQKESASLLQEIQKYDDKISVYDKAYAEQRAKDLTSFENLSMVRENLGSLSAKKDAANERIEEFSQRLKTAESRKQELVAQIEECHKKQLEISTFLSGRDEALKEKGEEIKDLLQTVNQFNQDIFTCKGQIESLNNNLNFYIGLKNRFEGYKDSVRRLLGAAKADSDLSRRIRGVIADLVTCQPQYELAIETIFGGAMQNIVTANGEDAKYLINYLKRTGLGIVTFLPVAEMRPRYDSREIERAMNEKGACGLADKLVTYDAYYDSVIKNLLGNTLVCDNTDNALAIAQKYSHSFRIVTLEGDIIATSGAMTGGSRKKDGGNLLQQERQIKECEEKIEAKKKQCQRLLGLKQKTDDERINEEKILEELRAKYQTSMADFAAIKQQEASLQQSAGEAETDISTYYNAVEELRKRMDSIETEEESTSASAIALKRSRSQADEEQAQQKEENDHLKKERQDIYEKYSSLQIEGASASNTIQTEKDTTARMQEEKKTLSSRLEEIQKSISSYQGEIDNWDMQAEKQALTAEEQKVVDILREEIEKLHQEKTQINQSQETLDANRIDTQEKINKDSAKRSKCEVEIGKMETNLENLRARIDEAYGMSYEDCLALKDENYDITQSYNNINSLRHKISALGPVNQNAVEDYDELKTRYEEMTVQRDDVQKAIEDSTKMLQEIKTNMQAQFDKGFEEINENFMHIFKELFGGGKAELQLDYQEGVDPLDAGVEIIACPPGKKMTKISLLSGGERALTAIAILFAILRSRPMPFCILDEIEAALDDANVDRFAQYLKHFSKDTQFIVITHRKPTMNQADSLFGVTMEEKGVSKIVSVKLSEVEERLGGDTVQ